MITNDATEIVRMAFSMSYSFISLHNLEPYEIYCTSIVLDFVLLDFLLVFPTL